MGNFFLMLRYLIIPLIFISLLTSCETQHPETAPRQGSILDQDMMSGIVLHSQTFGRYPMNLYELNPEKREEMGQSYRVSLQSLNEQYRKYRDAIHEENGKIVYLEKPESMSNL